MIFQNFHNCFDNELPSEQCGKLQAEASPETGRRGRWDNLVKPIQDRGLPDHRGTGQGGRQSHPSKKGQHGCERNLNDRVPSAKVPGCPYWMKDRGWMFLWSTTICRAE